MVSGDMSHRGELHPGTHHLDGEIFFDGLERMSDVPERSIVVLTLAGGVCRHVRHLHQFGFHGRSGSANPLGEVFFNAGCGLGVSARNILAVHVHEVGRCAQIVWAYPENLSHLFRPPESTMVTNIISFAEG
ncbi:hypothetical protein [Mycobacteroides abscessus]|uniref:hypothetical protein n=1 Tax=Mycobacteroides abscessus TaxID=36809 RepID=UPI002107EDF0|nr:hypothetical protein [Mycobacteroides abscessus]